MNELQVMAPFEAAQLPALVETQAETGVPCRDIELVIVNHAALRLSPSLVSRLRRQRSGAWVVEPELARKLLAEAGRREAWKRVVVAGGDGTLNRFLLPLLDLDLPVEVVPAGTANDLVGELRANEALDGGTFRREHSLDVVLANGLPFTTVGYLGFGSDVVRLVNGLRRKPGAGLLKRLLGRFIYVLGVLLIGARFQLPCYRLRIRTDDHELEVETPLVVAANQPTVGGTMRLADGTRNDDGRFRVLVFRPQGGFSLLRSIAALCRGVAPEAAGVESFEASSLEIEELSGRKFLFCADGEELTEDTRLSLSLHPRQLRIRIAQG